MAMVGCPKSLGDTEEHAERLRKRLRAAGIVVQRFVPVNGDRLYLRVSAAIYNTFDEFIILRDAVLQIVAELEMSK